MKSQRIPEDTQTIDSPLRVLIIGEGKNLYYLIETLYNILGREVFAVYHKHPGEAKKSVTQLAVLLLNSEEYLLEVGQHLFTQFQELTVQKTGARITFSSWLKHWQNLVGREMKHVDMDDFRIWALRMKQVRDPVELCFPVFHRHFLDFNWIESLIRKFKPHIILVTSTEAYQNTRITTSVRWALQVLIEQVNLKKRNPAKNWMEIFETLPIVISSYLGIEMKTIRNLQILNKSISGNELMSGLPLNADQQAHLIAKIQNIWKQDLQSFPIQYPDLYQDAFIESAIQILGALETLPPTAFMSNKSAKSISTLPKKHDYGVPIEMEICLHNQPGSLARFALGMAGLDPKLIDSVQALDCNGKSFLPNFNPSRIARYTRIPEKNNSSNKDRKKVSSQFLGSMTTEMIYINNHNNNEPPLEKIDKPIVSAITHFLGWKEKEKRNWSSRMNDWVKKQFHYKTRDMTLEGVDTPWILMLLSEIRNELAKINNDTPNENEHSNQKKYDKPWCRNWEGFEKHALSHRKCCRGRQECPIFSLCDTLNVDYTMGRLYSSRDFEKEKKPIKFSDRYIEHTYFVNNLDCSDECVYTKFLSNDNRPVWDKDIAEFNFCGDHGENIGSLGSLLSNLLLTKPEPNQENNNSVLLNISYLVNMGCTNKSCSFVRLYGVLKRKIDHEMFNSTSTPLRALLVSLLTNNDCVVDKDFTNIFTPRKDKILKSSVDASINNHFKETWLNEHVGGSVFDNCHLLLLKTNETEEYPVNEQVKLCESCSATVHSCLIKRRLIESGVGKRRRERRSTIAFLEISWWDEDIEQELKKFPMVFYVYQLMQYLNELQEGNQEVYRLFMGITPLYPNT